MDSKFKVGRMVRHMRYGLVEILETKPFDDGNQGYLVYSAMCGTRHVLEQNLVPL